MDSLRLLVVAAPDDATRLVTAVGACTAAEAMLAPTATALAAHAREGRWSAILVVPGGSLADADVARALTGAASPVFVIGPAVPAPLEAVATMALVWEGLDALPTLVETFGGTPEALRAAMERLAASGDGATAPAIVTPTDARPDPAPPTPRRARPTPPPASEEPAVPGDPEAAPAPRTRSRARSAAPPASAPPAGDDTAESLAAHLPIGIYRSTPDGRILFGNPALAALLGAESVDALGRIDVRTDLGYPRDAFVAHIQRGGEVRNLVVTWTDRTGRTVHTRENARAVRGPDGQPLYYEGTMEDVTAEVEAQHAERVRARQHAAVAHFAAAADTAADAADLYRAAVEALHVATGADWVLFSEHLAADEPAEASNRCAAWTDGFPSAGAVALDADPVFRGLPVPTETAFLRDVQAHRMPWLPVSAASLMQAHGIRALGCFPVLRAGVPLGALIAGYGAPHVFSDPERQAGETLAWHLAGHLARHHAERDLRDSEASLRFISEHTGQVLYRLRYPAPGTAGAPTFDYLSPSVTALTGYSASELDALGGLAALVEHREVLAGDGLIDGPPAAGTPCDGHYLALYRIQTRGGASRWVENNAYTWCDGGTPVGLVGVLHDVTDRRLLDEAQADAAQQLILRQAALVDLSRHDAADTAALLDRVARVACEATGADESAVWLASGAWMACRALHAIGHDAARPLPSFPLDSFDGVLASLHEQRVMAVDDATAAGADLGLEAYAERFAPQSLLVAPVRLRGETIGLVTIQRSDHPAAWSEGEADFAAALADTVALALERGERARAERALRLSEARYRALSDLTSDYAFAVYRRPDGRQRLAWATDAFERITGAGLDHLLDPAQRAAVVHPDSLAAAAAALDTLPPTDAADAGYAHEFELVGRDGRSRWTAHRARVAETAPDGTVLVYHSGQDVTDRKRSEAAIVAAREQAEAGRAAAEEMARLKSAFLANMSHEIRTPLTSILGYAELLAGEVDGEQRDYVHLIARGGRRLLDTLNSVLDLARLEAEGVHPTLTRLRVGHEVEQAVHLLTPLAAARGLDLTVATDAAATAMLDAACLARVVTNLVGNAIKFTPHGTVRVEVATEAAATPGGVPCVVLRVTDTGIGIPTTFLPHLFDEFRQEEGGEARSHEGSGLGLSITHRLVTLMGGEIGVESQRPGGSVFTVRFPSDASPAISEFPADPAPVPDEVPVLAPPAADAPPAEPEPHATAETEEPTPALAMAGGEAEGDTAPLAAALLPTLRIPAAAARLGPGDVTFLPSEFMGGPGTADAGAKPPASAPALPLMMDSSFFRPDPPPSEGPASPSPDATAARAEAPSSEIPAAGEPAVAADAAHVMIVRPSPPPEPVAAADPDDARPAILVVEDNADTRMLLERILRATYRVTAVADARSALIEMNRQRFRGFVLDINLGGKETGADVLRVARTLDGYADVFAIALTAYALPGDRDRLLEAGFDEYLSKPFTRQSLLDALAAGVRP